MEQLLAKELEKRHAWFSAAMAFGALSFFEIHAINVICLLICIVIISAALLYKITINQFSNFIFLMLLFFVIGQISCHFREYKTSALSITDTIHDVLIEADVEKIEDHNNAKRIYLVNIVTPEENITLKRIRIKTRLYTQGIEINSRIAIRCTLMPSPPIAMPGGFNMERFLHFKEISAIGYSISKIKILSSQRKINYIENLRKIIANRINELMPMNSAALASGILIGDSSTISEEDFNAMRISGTAHLIAISGMHIAVISGIIFFFTRAIFRRIEYIACRFDTKKFAALLSICVSYFYLLLAGSPVSAERAFIMSSIVLLAIIINKETDPIKSLSIALIILLIIQPENVLSPSLQMSIAACLGLIAGFHSSHYILLTKASSKNILSKSICYLFSIVYATVTAGTASSIFIAYHFKQFSTYNIISNLLSVPLNDFFIMPCGLIALLLMPFGLENIGFIPMQYGINLLLDISHNISKLPHSSLYIPIFSKHIICFLVLGLFILCVGQTIFRYLGAALIIVGLIFLSQEKPPSILISGSAELFALNHSQTLFISSKNHSRYIRKVWQDSSGAKKSLTLPKEGLCNKDLCHYRLGLFNIVIMKDSHENYICNQRIDLFINMADDAEPCKDIHFSILRSDIIEGGSYGIWHYGDRLYIKNTKNNHYVLVK